MPNPARILIADDHAIVREGVRVLLARAFAGAVFGEAQDCDDTLRRVRSAPWDVLVLDVSMPGENGFEVLRRVKAISPEMPVLFLSMHVEPCFAVRALGAGAQGYVGKDAGREELIRAVSAVLAGEKYVSASIAAQIEAPRHALPA